jgi:hypothetical protein
VVSRLISAERERVGRTVGSLHSSPSIPPFPHELHVNEGRKSAVFGGFDGVIFYMEDSIVVGFVPNHLSSRMLAVPSPHLAHFMCLRPWLNKGNLRRMNQYGWHPRMERCLRMNPSLNSEQSVNSRCVLESVASHVWIIPNERIQIEIRST